MFNILAQKATAAKKGAKPVSEVTTDIHNFFHSKQCVPARPIALLLLAFPPLLLPARALLLLPARAQ